MLISHRYTPATLSSLKGPPLAWLNGIYLLHNICINIPIIFLEISNTFTRPKRIEMPLPVTENIVESGYNKGTLTYTAYTPFKIDTHYNHGQGTFDTYCISYL